MGRARGKELPTDRAPARGFEFGFARAPVDYSDTDAANLHAGTLWQAIGDWEVVNHLGPGAPASSDLNLEFARWIAALENAKAAPEGDGDDPDLEAVDWLFLHDQG